MYTPNEQSLLDMATLHMESLAAEANIGQITVGPKIDTLAMWLEQEYLPAQDDTQAFQIVWNGAAMAHRQVLEKMAQQNSLLGEYHFVGFEASDNPVAAHYVQLGEDGKQAYHSGAYLYHFQTTGAQKPISILVLTGFMDERSFYNPDTVCVAAIPQSFLPTWAAFVEQCEQLIGSLEPSQKVIIIGGRSHSFVPKVDWEDIILPEALKEEILGDVKAFFQKGVGVYQRLKLKPFRKLLLAGIPGTGKTMLCSALAKWALEQHYLVIYISSADKDGPSFGKIEHALDIASRSKVPSLILLEELDAYLMKKEEKALVLNVLDGSESAINEQGTLMIATTNYPEAIDERVLKRPGRLDRIFIIPETQQEAAAVQMLKRYLGEMWQEDHAALAEDLVGYPGAFIREVAIYALTQVAYEDLPNLPLEVLQTAYHRLKDQIEARDDFLHRRGHLGLLNTN